jgi:hypothetical protein
LQLPQLLGSVLRFTLQPLACKVLSQLAQFALQALVQAPLAHAGVALVAEQTTPQSPQLLGSFAMSTHVSPHSFGFISLVGGPHLYVPLPVGLQVAFVPPSPA